MPSRKTKWLVVTHLVRKGLVDRSPKDCSRSPDFQISDAMYVLVDDKVLPRISPVQSIFMIDASKDSSLSALEHHKAKDGHKRQLEIFIPSIIIASLSLFERPHPLDTHHDGHVRNGP